MVREGITIAIMAFGAALLIKWGAWIAPAFREMFGDLWMVAPDCKSLGPGEGPSGNRAPDTQTKQYIHPSSHDGEASQ